MEQDPTWILERQVGRGTSPHRGSPALRFVCETQASLQPDPEGRRRRVPLGTLSRGALLANVAGFMSGHQVHFKSRPGNRGRSKCGTTHVAHLEFPRETSIILRCAGKAGNTFHTKKGNRLSCRDQEGRWGSDSSLLRSIRKEGEGESHTSKDGCLQPCSKWSGRKTWKQPVNPQGNG